ncbi:hypothetical protein TWF506_005729 [Arthrobotrys conoides]|uniref:Uncharacterized protein n=1 Tax=Arthrobotrys conoides TaxID=74498 RepID=A0AAN8S0B9_9PEZI
MRHSRSGSRTPSPPLQRSEPMNTASRNIQPNERLMLSNALQLNPRVQRRPQKPKQPRPANRNIFTSLNRDVPVNERLFAQAQTIAESMDLQPGPRNSREEQIDLTYALARYVKTSRNIRKSTTKALDLSRWEATTPTQTLSIPQGVPSPYTQGQISILSMGPTSPTLSHQQASVYTPERIVAHAGAQFEAIEEEFDTEDML